MQPTFEVHNSIPATARSDDHVVEVRFNAVTFFENASEEELTALIDCNFGGNLPADEVAIRTATTNSELANLFTYIEARNRVARESIGFECHVEENEALEWLAENRPDILTAADLAQCNNCRSITHRDLMSKATRKDPLICEHCSADHTQNTNN